MSTALNANDFLFGLGFKDVMGLSVLAATVAALGSIIDILVKDYFFSRSIERFKQRLTLDALYQRYRDPLLLASCDLASRLIEILDSYPTTFLSAGGLGLATGKTGQKQRPGPVLPKIQARQHAVSTHRTSRMARTLSSGSDLPASRRQCPIAQA